ncbi:cytochrome ubiquinol oxidase subunit I [Oceanithermus sp.]
MSEVALARLQFATTTTFHFFFVPLTLGLVILVAIMETLYVVRGDEKYKRMTKFWGTLFLINFAIGVATGLVQEFQFGMNWSEYSRFMGDIFGVPLAIEALLAFFMESTFIGVWVFSWDKLPKKLHAALIWLVALGSNLSAFWILVANSFMQHPTGYVLRNGRAELESFVAIATNPNVFYQFTHVFFAGLSTGAFVVMGISAWHLLRRREVAEFAASMKIGVIAALVGSIMVATVGHFQAQYIIKEQPMKFAAMEAVWEDTPDPAPWSLFAIIDENRQENPVNIEIPYLGSLLSYNKLSGSITGMKTIQKEYEAKYGPGNYIPPVKWTYWSFRVMVLVGGLMILLALWGLALWGRFETSRAFLVSSIWMIASPFIANSTGWWVAEIGRQPWIVQGLLKTSEAVTPASVVPAGTVLLSLIGFNLLYLVLGLIDLGLMIKYAQRPMREPEEAGDEALAY